ncbi:Protein SUPPRESSOR OF QUENCHING 1 chloroplastic [Bienertia sinuspersici]
MLMVPIVFLTADSRGRLVAGSFQGKTGHVDGKPSDSRFSHPKGVAIDDKGNVYIADDDNLAIRKVGEGGVTTIAGGKSNIAGYRDGPSEDAKFSTDFDLVYVPSTCSLLVVDRGNAAIRQISLNQEDCDSDYSSISTSDIVMVIGAVFVGYISCVLHQGLGTDFLSNILQPSSSVSVKPVKEEEEEQNSIMESAKEEQVAVFGRPSFGQMATDLSKLALKSLRGVVLPILPSRKGLTPLKDTLKMPEDEVKVNPPLVQKQRIPAPLSESRQAYTTEKFPEAKAPKMRTANMKDASLSKHKSSKRQEYSEFYGSSEVPHRNGQTRPKAHKERKHRHRDKSGEVSSGQGQGQGQGPINLNQDLMNSDQ